MQSISDRVKLYLRSKRTFLLINLLINNEKEPKVKLAKNSCAFILDHFGLSFSLIQYHCREPRTTQMKQNYKFIISH